MSNYRRSFQPGGTFFLTLVAYERVPLFDDEPTRVQLRQAIDETRRDRPFDLIATVLLPDHLHLLIQLPTGDPDYSTRVSAIKARFTHLCLRAGTREKSQTASRHRQRYRGIWQKRFWEHQVRDEDDLIGCIEYIHYNPVKHGVARCPHAWQWSSFSRYVRDGHYPAEWCCACDGSRNTMPPREIERAEMD